MKELWTTNPFHLMNRPFAEIGYNSSGLNIVPERLLLATRRPSTHYPLASGSAFFDPLRATCRCATNHATHGTTSGAPPASHLPSFCVASGAPCTASAISPQTIRHLAARHPLPCAASVGSLQAICPPVHRAIPASPCKPSVIARHSILRPPRVVRWHPAGNLLARTDALTARRTNRRREQEPLIPALRNC